VNSVLPKLLRNEIDKALHAKIAYLGIAATSLVSIVIFFGINMDEIGFINAWAFTGMVMQAVFAEIGLIFTALFAALLVAEEIGTGTIRIVLASPVRRRDVYLAKVGAGVLFMIMLSTTTLLLTLALAPFKYAFGPVADTVGVIYQTREVLLNFILAFVASWIPLTAVVTFGVFLSTITTKPGVAVATTLGSLVLAETVRHFIDIGPYLFTSYLGTPWVIFHDLAQGVDYQWCPRIWQCIGVSSVYALIAFAAGLFVFCRRDLNV